MQWPADTLQKQVAKFNQAAVFLEMDAGKNNWDGTIGFPPDYNWVNCNTETDPMIREEILQSKDLDINSHWLVHKEKVRYSSTKETMLCCNGRKGSVIELKHTLHQFDNY